MYAACGDNNPSVSLLGWQLPLHKGAFRAPQSVRSNRKKDAYFTEVFLEETTDYPNYTV